ncbi:uncharacterized protein LOC143058442 [Mytilus galloprovincialis]|uniref:uncharacterized protein LOC143058442 n=1 Tax=Mytilus galloprovincialis TaxID=29158 RepID=UPI003F7BCFB7
MGSSCSSSVGNDVQQATSPPISSLKNSTAENRISTWFDIHTITKKLSLKRRKYNIQLRGSIYNSDDGDFITNPIAILKINIDVTKNSSSSYGKISPIKKSHGVLKDPSVDWGELRIQKQVPRSLPPILQTGVTTIYGILEEDSPLLANVTLTGTVDKNEFEISASIDNDSIISEDDEYELRKYIQKTEEKEERQKSKTEKKSLIKQSNVDAGYDSCPETSSQRISLASVKNAFTVKAPNTRKTSIIVHRKKTPSTCTINNSFREAYFNLRNDEEDFDSAIKKPRRDTPVHGRLGLPVKSTWRSTSELLREDTVEENAYLGIQRTRLRSESLMPATSLCGSNDALLLLPNKNEEEEDLNYIQQYNSIKTGVSERNNSFPNETVLKSRRKTVTFGIPLTFGKSRKGRCLSLSGIDGNFMGLI